MPIDEGTLHSGIHFQRTQGLRGFVAPSAATSGYAVVQELGRRPRKPGPPLAPILRWVQRKFKLRGREAQQRAFLVRRKLHQKGMLGRFFFRRARAHKATRATAKRPVQAAVARWKRRVA